MALNAKVFVDGSNLHATMKALGESIDFGKLPAFVRDLTGAEIVQCNYYTAVFPDDEVQQIRPLIDWLEYNGWRLVTKEAKRYDRDDGTQRIKGNIDIEICVDALSFQHYDIAVLFTGDGDFAYLVNRLQLLGKKVVVVSSIRTRPSLCADALRRACDQFVELSDQKQIMRRSSIVSVG
jgi:uncharacterized LabA/DUF88 family protein